MATTATFAPLIHRALSGQLPVREHDTDQRIIDAMLAELLVTPLRKLSLEDVARRAGLTRMTVYRRFGDREGVIEATLAREISRFLDGVLASDDPDAPPSERMATAFATGATLAHDHPVIAHLQKRSPSDLLDTLLADDGFVISAVEVFLAAKIIELAPEREPDAGRLSELLARLLIALVLMPPPSVDLTDPNQARQLARELIVPIIVPAADHRPR